MRKYHYEYFAYSDNLCYGRLLLGQSRVLAEAHWAGILANKGAFVIEKHRVYD